MIISFKDLNWMKCSMRRWIPGFTKACAPWSRLRCCRCTSSSGSKPPTSGNVARNASWGSTFLAPVAVVEVLEAILTRGRSMAPQVLIPTVILNAFIGFIIFTAAQYIDDLFIGRARKRLEKTLEHLDDKVRTDVDYDNRRELLDADVLRADAMEILTHYDQPDSFWRDYLKVREADPTVPAEVKALIVPAFERFLRFHVDGQYSEVARQHRFNSLFIEAHQILLSRERDKYVLNHLKALSNK